MIIVKDLHKKFDNNHVLRGVNYHVHQGEKIVIIGPSGSGKSTFLRCLNLLETPTSGEIWFDGQLITSDKVNINHVRQHMGMVFQNFNLFNNLSIMDNITLAPVKLKLQSREEAIEALRACRPERKGRFLSEPVIRWTEAAYCDCPLPCHESKGNAV